MFGFPFFFFGYCTSQLVCSTAQENLSLMASNSKKNNLGSQYRKILYLGEGTSYGTVILASHLKTEALVAIKMLEINTRSQ